MAQDDAQTAREPFIRRVFHPTDFSPASDLAFAHALAIALARQATFTIMHADKGAAESRGRRFPRVRETLQRWGLLEAGAVQADVFRQLGVKVRKVGVESSDPVDAILDFLGDHPADLMVLATEGREGLPRFLRGSVAQRAARAAGVRTLFVPGGCAGFVSPKDGHLSLRRILVPVAPTPDPGIAVEMATRAADALGDPPVEIHALHVGDDMPFPGLPEGPRWTFTTSNRPGAVIEGILDAAREGAADLIVMATDGRDGIADFFRGSHVERVVRGASCPVLALPVPAGGSDEAGPKS